MDDGGRRSVSFLPLRDWAAATAVIPWRAKSRGHLVCPGGRAAVCDYRRLGIKRRPAGPVEFFIFYFFVGVLSGVETAAAAAERVSGGCNDPIIFYN